MEVGFTGFLWVWGLTFSFALVAVCGDGVGFLDKLFGFFDVVAGGVEDAEEVLFGVVGMGEEGVEGGVVDGFGGGFGDEAVEGCPADADIDAEDAFAVEVGDVVVVVVGVGDGDEGEHLVIAEEVEDVAVVFGSVDVFQAFYECFEFCLVHCCSFWSIMSQTAVQSKLGMLSPLSWVGRNNQSGHSFTNLSSSVSALNIAKPFNRSTGSG